RGATGAGGAAARAGHGGPAPAPRPDSGSPRGEAARAPAGGPRRRRGRPPSPRGGRRRRSREGTASRPSGSSGSSRLVAGSARPPVLVELPVEVKSLEHDLDGGGDASRVAGRPEPRHRVPETGRPSRVSLVIGRRHHLAHLPREPATERLEQLRELGGLE